MRQKHKVKRSDRWVPKAALAVAITLASAMGNAQNLSQGDYAHEKYRDLDLKEMEAVYDKAAIDRIRIGDIEVDMLQVIPKANPEFTCMGPVNDGKVTDLECFPTKTNPSPTMW